MTRATSTLHIIEYKLPTAYIQMTVSCRQRDLTGTVVHIPYSQSSAGDLRVQLYCGTVPDFHLRFMKKLDRKSVV